MKGEPRRVTLDSKTLAQKPIPPPFPPEEMLDLKNIQTGIPALDVALLYILNPSFLLIVFAAAPIVAFAYVLWSFAFSQWYHPKITRQVDLKHILVTGASKGLGKAIAIQLGQAGAHITLVARGTDKDASGVSSLEHAAEEVRKAAKEAKKDIRVRTLAVDLTNYNDVLTKLRTLYEGPKDKIDWVICNAGASTPGLLADQVDSEKDVVKDMMNLNYFTATNVTRAVTKIAKEKGDFAEKVAKEKGIERRSNPWPAAGFSGYQAAYMPRKIVLVGSVLSYMSFIGYSAYSGSKYALMGFADALRSELAPIRTRVHIYLPATMDTPGYQNENTTKPYITKKIEGVAATLTPEKAAKQLIAGLTWDRYAITNDFLGELMRVISCISGPRPSPFMEALAAPIIIMTMNIWNYFNNVEIIEFFNKAPPKEATVEKKNN
ncbi:3-dehydrosphinganine reductase [Chytridiales sp. JEL 0842]|nr:3-dehydrosphinganine reductase [Chytridiales sp. JEL 0842]